MSGITNLSELIRSMRPVLWEGSYVFCTVKDTTAIDWEHSIGWFREREGITVILPQAYAAELALPYDYIAAWITLEVHSSLAAVGLTAHFSAALAVAGISCNVVAGFYHDHIFVAKETAAKAMDVLLRLAAPA